MPRDVLKGIRWRSAPQVVHAAAADDDDTCMHPHVHTYAPTHSHTSTYTHTSTIYTRTHTYTYIHTYHNDRTHNFVLWCSDLAMFFLCFGSHFVQMHIIWLWPLSFYATLYFKLVITTFKLVIMTFKLVITTFKLVITTFKLIVSTSNTRRLIIQAMPYIRKRIRATLVLCYLYFNLMITTFKLVITTFKLVITTFKLIVATFNTRRVNLQAMTCKHQYVKLKFIYSWERV